ncbi:MAG: baseplate J/gp47 family protein [Acidisphaera sp.]|nr:baseplate J/gp47 family protein [Acidisphaera sp.]
MQLPLQNFSTLVQNMAAAVQGRAAQLLDLTVGSSLRALLEASASVALWIQWLILLVLQMTRAATSNGPDLDSWMADFTLTRMPASAASGIVTFSRFTPTNAALIPVGAVVRTADGTQSFSVTAAPSVPAWNAPLNGYVLPANVASLDVPVVAAVAGSAGNVQAGGVTQLATAISGVDTVANAGAFQGGLDAESDPAFRARFANFIESRSRATPLAIGFAVTSIQQGLQYSIQENVDQAGAGMMGWFVVTVDDGTGSPPASLLQTAAAAIEAVRPIGSIYVVQAPTVVPVSVSMLITVATGAVKTQIVGPVATALTNYIDTLPIAAPLAWSRLAQVAYDADPAVTNVTGVLLNGGTADVLPPIAGVIKAGSVAVS